MKRFTIAMNVVLIATSFVVDAGETLPNAAEKQIKHLSEGYIPGMGEIMGVTQMRHSKLWFAGQAQNWGLADYRIG